MHVTRQETGSLDSAPTSSDGTLACAVHVCLPIRSLPISWRDDRQESVGIRGAGGSSACSARRAIGRRQAHLPLPAVRRCSSRLGPFACVGQSKTFAKGRTMVVKRAEDVVDAGFVSRCTVDMIRPDAVVDVRRKIWP